MSRDKGEHQNRRDTFGERISEIERRRIRERHRKHKQLWFGFGMMGIIGWSVSIPTLAALALGIWLDSKLNDSISWTLTGVVLGVVIGSVTAWYWIKHEQEDGED